MTERERLANTFPLNTFRGETKRQLVEFVLGEIAEARLQAKLDEHEVITIGVVEAFNEAAAEGDSYNALHIFDDWRASRYRDLLRNQTNKPSEEKS